MIKLHSKKSLAHSFELGERWRNQLTDALLGSLPKLQNNYLSCLNSNSKMVGSSAWILNEKVSGFEQQFFSENINFTDYEFVGGTMFMVDFNLIMDWFLEQSIYKRFYNQFEDGYIGDGSIAHQLERVLGCLVKVKGKDILRA
jgi:lipopolysaccharide biosynthesis protein